MKQMRISIAGAGAGKTTKMADRIIACNESLDEHLNIYCIAFTNNAVDHIANKLSKHFGSIPKRIKISTIHSFLYQEIIKPYYFLLYGKQYEKISNIKLSNNIKIKKRKIRQLDDRNVLHVDSFSQKALWVMVKRSSDKKREKAIRKIIHKEFIKYCGAIYIDEAQDIDENILKILKQFNDMGLVLEIVGDPKQDLKGFGNLRKLVELYPQNVEYITECYRCPQIHLDISNRLLAESEKQKSYSELKGELSVIYEADIDVKKYIEDNNFDLKFISKKNDRYETHGNEKSTIKLDTLYYELIECVEKLYPYESRIMIERVSFFLAENLLKTYEITQNAKEAMRMLFKNIRLDKKDYAKIIQIVQYNEIEKNGIVVNSIESIKGQEGYNCLFILTTDLAEYLFGKKKFDNKIKNLLYVALTRSLDKLTVLITKEVEKEYGRDKVNKYFELK